MKKSEIKKTKINMKSLTNEQVKEKVVETLQSKSDEVFDPFFPINTNYGNTFLNLIMSFVGTFRDMVEWDLNVQEKGKEEIGGIFYSIIELNNGVSMTIHIHEDFNAGLCFLKVYFEGPDLYVQEVRGMVMGITSLMNSLC